VPAVLYKAHLHGKPGLLLTNLPLWQKQQDDHSLGKKLLY
jgi:hypothetical protein